MEEMAITLKELLRARGFVPDEKRVKLVRHAGVEVDSLQESGWLETYQQYQSKPRFDTCGQIVAFVGEEGSASRLIGVYDVGRKVASSQTVLPTGCPESVMVADGFHYALAKRAGFEDLEDRLIIDWGSGALAWHQWFTDRPVIEIRRPGRALPPFRDYLEVHLKFSELVTLTSHADAHPDWRAALSAVGAIYLIVDSNTGQQYVGSATGSAGLWQRWCDYAKSGHGGNHFLQKCCAATPAQYPRAFKFSILDTFSRNLSRAEAIRIEEHFKNKLGTRAFGLN
jgi:hypothetical protein